MAYDRGLEARIDEKMEGRDSYEKKKLFGGVCYLTSGNMAFGIWQDYLIVRCGQERYAECLRQEHAKSFDVTGRPMSGWVMVSPEGIEEDRELEKWLAIGDSLASSLPRKKSKK